MDQYMQNLLENIEIQLSYEDIDMDTLLKSVKLSVSNEYDTQLSKICDYIDIVSQVFDKKLFVFFNLKTVLEESELIELYEYCNYKKVHLLLCENTNREKVSHEKITLIDKDLCQII
jgi:CRISPR type II-A-associated protein Csn2